MTTSQASPATGAAINSARRLIAAANAVLVLVIIAAALGLIAGIVLAILGTGNDRGVGIAVAIGCVISLPATALPYMAAQTFARYVLMRAERA